MKKKICKYLALFVLVAFNADAQIAGFHYRAPIDGVTADGFYNIVLTPQINAHVKTDYSDLRIVNDSGKWVPHLVRYPNGESCVLSVLYFLKIAKLNNTALYTDIVLAKDFNDPILGLYIKVKNTVAERFCTLTGSDDMTSWFTINDSIFIKPDRDAEEGTSSFRLQFPPCSYKFYKIHILNNNKAPYNIIDISADTEETKIPDVPNYRPPIENPSAMISQIDSGKISYIRIDQSATFHFSTIALKLSGVKYYNRTVDLYIPPSAIHSFANPGQLTNSFNISNNSTLQFHLLVSNAKTFYLLIHNDDNLPLKVKEVKTYSNYRVATVYLEKTKHYQLLLDNAVAAANYDLALNDIPAKDSLPLATIGNIAAIPEPAAATISKDSSQQLIWLAIGLAALVLVFFTYRLVTDMNKAKN